MTAPGGTRPVTIANCSGFYGDRLSAAREMVDGGPIDVLTGDWLAELTMWILARSRDGRPGQGFARTFLRQVEDVLGTCLDRGIRIVANAGGLDPDGCAAEVAALAARLGLTASVAAVTGDDLLARLPDLVGDGSLVVADDGPPIDPGRAVAANAYLGCWGIAHALGAGADVVVTGRVTDAALVCGPAAWHHGWSRTDLDALAGAVVAGHVIECGTQATGGNYSFFDEVPGRARVGFPWAEIAADGTAVIGKHPGTGGLVDIGTVTSQLVYEIGAPAYLGPDVVARFDTVRLEQVGTDQVRISGTRGEPPTGRLKVVVNERGGFRNDVAVALTGLDVEAKAAFLEDAFWAACPVDRDELSLVEIHVDRTDRPDPATNVAATALWRLVVQDDDEAKVGRAVSGAVVETALASIPGFYVPTAGPTSARAFGVARSALVDAGAVPQHVHAGGQVTTIGSDHPLAAAAGAPLPVAPPAGSAREDGPSVAVALGRLVGARSGDKGGDANLGVFARSAPAWEWLDRTLTTELLVDLLPELAPHRIERHRLPNLFALNFVIYGLLGGGAGASTRPDVQAKSLAEWLRSRVVWIPEELVADAERRRSAGES